MNLEFTVEKIPIPHTALQSCLSDLRKEIVKTGMLSWRVAPLREEAFLNTILGWLP